MTEADKLEILNAIANIEKMFSNKSLCNADLFAALAKAQSEFNTADLNDINSYTQNEFSNLSAIVKASRPALTKNGLCVIQKISNNDDGQSILTTTLAHESGQQEESVMRILPSSNDIQTVSSHIEFLRRTSYSAIVGVILSGQDDDGERAVYNQRVIAQQGLSLNTNYNPKESSHETITKEQLEELHYELTEYPDIVNQILTDLRIQALADMPKSKFLKSIERIRTIKQIRSGTRYNQDKKAIKF